MYMSDSVLSLEKHVGVGTETCQVLWKVLPEGWAECESKSPLSLATVILKVLLLYW